MLYTLVPDVDIVNRIVVPRINAHWDDVAYALHYKTYTVSSISRKHNDDPTKCCKELLKDWIITDNGDGPKIWSTLLRRLKNVVDLLAVRDEIIKELENLS